MHAATVVIPTHNRAAALYTALDALARQDQSPDTFEVVVVPNGCTDDTVEQLQRYQATFRLTVVPLTDPGASLARNTGAARARAPIVIFMDDDITPDTWFISAHLAAHRRAAAEAAVLSPAVVVGYLPAVLQPERDRFAVALRGWWEAMFDRMRQPGHRFNYTDLLSGNFSIERVTFTGLGGFDTGLRCHEDYDLGYRLIAAGARILFAERASGSHTDVTRLPRACWRKREEGVADVQLARKYPELRALLPIGRPRTPNQRVIRALALRMPAVGDQVAALLVWWLGVLDRIGAHSAWSRVMDGLLGYWYERGLADALGTPAALEALMAGARLDVPEGVQTLEVDLAAGLDEALVLIDAVRPGAVSFRVGAVKIGEIPWHPGAERLAARHLRGALVKDFHKEYAEALHAIGAWNVAARPAKSKVPCR